ncbi:MAG: response regulator [Candidatus Anammoxibacter sp.]
MAKRILVIDDEKGVRDSFVLALEDSGYIIETSDCGEQGLEMFKESSYDLIYIDLKMPGISGIETVREIRKNDSDVHIYIVTAFYKEHLDELESLKADKINFELAKKPLDRKQIITVTNSVLN